MTNPEASPPSSQTDSSVDVLPAQWWEIEVIGSLVLEESLFWRLQEEGCQGMASQRVDSGLSVKSYLPCHQIQEEGLGAIATRLRQDAQALGAPPPQITWQRMTEEDWADNWKRYWHPQAVGQRLLINPAWLPAPETGDRIVLRLNPGVAFGTGTHATTQLCLQALERQMQDNPSPLKQAQSQQPMTIADIGCGSGILAIAALLLGAEQAYGVDTDLLAVGAAQDSRQLNGFCAEQMVVAPGSIDTLAALLPGPVQGFCCNILAPVILALIPQFADITQVGSWGILSGLLDSQVAPILTALSQSGWQVLQTDHQQDWCCLVIHRLG